MPEVGVLIVDDDLSSQRALKSVLDAEGWRVRIVQRAPDALGELANGAWNLAIVNVAVADVRGPLFAILKELLQAEVSPSPDASGNGESLAPEPSPRARIRVLFLVSALTAKEVVPLLEQEDLPYSLKPYHLHDFLEKVSDLLIESGAIGEPIRTMQSLAQGSKRRRRDQRFGRDAQHGRMFAAREDYQMTEEEMIEFERQEEEERKKRQKKEREQLR